MLLSGTTREVGDEQFDFLSFRCSLQMETSTLCSNPEHHSLELHIVRSLE